MANNNTNNKKNIHPAAKSHSQKKTVQTRFTEWYWLIGILVLTFALFFPVIKNAFTDWDDPEYILNNPLIRNLNAHNVKRIFSEIYFGNYQPLHIFSYAIEYQVYKLDPSGYHATSVVLHLIATGLVCWFIFMLSGKPTVAIVTALLFGIHPMHVESVAWAAERKDLLYATFYIAALIAYVKYIRNNEKGKYLFLTFLLFALSAFSKAMACSLPPVLLLLDYYLGRKLNSKAIIEKIPFFLLAIGLGIMSIHAASTTHSVATNGDYSLGERILFASSNLVTYVGKLIVPVSLSAFYPYPLREAGGSVPAYYYLGPVAVIVLIVLVIRSMKKTRLFFFAAGFFAITVFLVLQLLPVGRAIMADRYTYIPSIGLFYLLAEGFASAWNGRGKGKGSASPMKWPAAILLGMFVIFFSASTFARCGIWKNGMTLWNDVISKYQTVPEAYNNRGILLANEKKYDEALSDYTKALALEPNFPKTHNNRGILLSNKKRYDEALIDYNKALEIQPDYAIAYNSRGVLYKTQRKYDLALSDLNKAVQLQGDYAEAYINRGDVFKSLKRFDESKKDYDKAIELQPNNAKTYNGRGLMMASQKRYDEAIQDYNKAIELDVKYANAYNNRGGAYMNEKKYEEATRDFTRAIDLQPNLAEAYYNRGVMAYDTGKKAEGCADLQKASGLGLQVATDEYNRLCH